MLDHIISMWPPLSEHLVVRYFNDCLTDHLTRLRPGRRVVRMTGRKRDKCLDQSEIYEGVLQNLIEDSI